MSEGPGSTRTMQKNTKNASVIIKVCRRQARVWSRRDKHEEKAIPNILKNIICHGEKLAHESQLKPSN